MRFLFWAGPENYVEVCDFQFLADAIPYVDDAHIPLFSFLHLITDAGKHMNEVSVQVFNVPKIHGNPAHSRGSLKNVENLLSQCPDVEGVRVSTIKPVNNKCKGVIAVDGIEI